MLDHVTLGVRDVERSKTFYDLAPRPLGIERLYAEGTTGAGYGVSRKAFFWIGTRDRPQTGAHAAGGRQSSGDERSARPFGLSNSCYQNCRSTSEQSSVP